MSQIHTMRQRRSAARTPEGKGTVPQQTTPTRIQMPGQYALGEGMGSRLEELMQAKYQQHFLDRQIPAAEQEADRLSAGLSARTPEEVKHQLGERLGADFSQIQFHMDSGARAAADGIGARAYTSGSDVYFGQGGFDPDVAAHELVHTVQQGQVESSAHTLSAPAGGVQMWPWSKASKKKREERLLKPIGRDREDEEIQEAAVRLGNWGSVPEPSDEELDEELERIMRGEDRETEEDPDAALAAMSEQIDAEGLGSPTDGLREAMRPYQNAIGSEKDLNKWSKKADKRLKKLTKQSDRYLKDVQAYLKQMDEEEQLLMSMDELPELEGFDAEAELERLMRGENNQGDGQSEVTDEEMQHLEQEAEAELEAERQAAAEPKKKKGFFSKMGSGIKKFGRKAWDKTGSRIIRKHHDAMNELHEAMESGDWATLTPEEQKSWIKKNPLAYKRYMSSEKARNETSQRIRKREDEQVAAAAFLSNAANQELFGKSSMLTTAAGPSGSPGGAPGSGLVIGRAKTDDAAAYAGTSTEDKLDKAADVADNLAIPPSVANAFQEAGWISKGGEKALGGMLGGVNVLTGGYGMYQSGKKVAEAVRSGNQGQGLDAMVDLVGNTSKTIGGAGSIAKAFGKEAGGKVAAGADVISGSVDVYKGAKQIHAGRMKHNAMEDFQRQYYGPLSREQVAENDRLLMDISTQGKMEGTRQKIKGSGKVITGAVDAAAGVAELGGASAAVGAGLKAGNAVLKGGFAAANQMQKNRMVNKVVQQTTGLSDDVIRQFQKDNGIKSFSRAKQALMKAYGYESGTRAELYADQTEKRGQYMANLANSGVEGDKANQLVTGLGVKKTGGTYSAEDITKSLGHWKSRAEISSGHGALRKMARRHRTVARTNP